MNGCYTSQLESNYHEKQHVVDRVEQESEFFMLMKTICLTRHIELFEKNLCHHSPITYRIK